MKGDISKYTLEISVNSLTFEALEPQQKTITVTVNGSSDTNCYDIMTDMNWITIKSDNGNITIVPSTNNITNYTREGYIVFYHKADHEIFKVLDVVQENINFQVIANRSDIEFSYDIENSKTTTIAVFGGRKRFYINAVNMYDKDGVRLTYDNAFDFTITPVENVGSVEYSEYTLLIRSRGMITDNVRYEVILTHSDLRTIYTTLNITYETMDLDLPKIPSQEFMYCPDGVTRNTDIENVSVLSVQPLSKKNIEKIEEHIDVECNGIRNPDIIDLSNGETRIKVYTVIDNNGNKETDSDIYVKLSSSIATVKYAKEEYTMDYKVIYVKKTDTTKFKGIRYCGMIIYNRERRKQYIKTVLKVKG